MGTISWRQIARSEPLNDSFRQSAVERLNASAKAAKDDDVATVESLSTTLIANLISVELPGELRTTIQTRLVAAELDYRRGGKGIPDAQVVRTINELAKEFAAPEYAKTTLGQVRFLRATMTGVFPQLLVPQRIHPNKIKESGQQHLSPMGATLLTALMLQQKLINEEFQVAPKDWRDHLQKRNTEVWQQYRENKGAPKPQSAPRVSSRPDSAKTKELRQLIGQRIVSMTDADMVNLTSLTLDQLGIPR